MNVSGKKFGGRQKGSVNKKSQALIDRLKELGCDPIAGMAAIAMDPEQKADLRGRMFAELAKYVLPQLKSIEVESDVYHHSVSVPDARELSNTLRTLEQSAEPAEITVQ